MKRNPQAQLNALLDGLGVDRTCSVESPKFFEDLGMMYRKHFLFVQNLKEQGVIEESPPEKNNHED